MVDFDSETAARKSLPPGTQRIESTNGANLILAPSPSNDPNQPLNWSMTRKVKHMVLLCMYTIFTFAVLTVATPLWVNINLETGVSFTDLNNAYATSSGALAVGCIIFVPLALKFGRRPVYIATALLMTASAIWQGRAKTTGDFVGSNVLSGVAGAVNEALFQLTVSDLFFVHQRASANGVYLTAVIFGNYLGPVAAGYVAVSQSWRWTFYYLTIFMGITSILMIFALEETKYSPLTITGRPVALSSAKDDVPEQKSSNAEKENDPTATSLSPQMTQTSTVVDASIPTKSYRQRHSWYTLDPQSQDRNHNFFRHFLQPFEILVQFPAVAFAALQYGWLVSMLSVLAVTQATIYPAAPYNFSAASVGLMSLPPAIGGIIGSLLGGPLVDFLALYVAKRRGGIHEPETRLWTFLIPGLSMVAGILMYGLTIAKGMPWAINAVGAGLVGFALGGCGDMALTYVQDSYQEILGDALVGVVFVRNGISTGMIFAVPPWMQTMGPYNMFALNGVLAAVIALTCVPFLIWGRDWRVALAAKYQRYADLQY